MIRDGIRPFSLPSRSSVAERRPYKPVVAGSIPAGRTGRSPSPVPQTPNQARSRPTGQDRFPELWLARRT